VANSTGVCTDHDCCILFEVPAAGPGSSFAGEWHLRWSTSQEKWTLTLPGGEMREIAGVGRHPLHALVGSVEGVSFADAQPSLTRTWSQLSCSE
jgi:hypothetical protein